MSNRDELYTQAEEKLNSFLAQQYRRKTPERYEVLRIICSIDDIFTLEQLADRMRAEGKFQVSRSTLFNIIDLFVEARLLIKHNLPGAAHYECCVQDRPYLYLVCTQCGSIHAIRHPQMEKVIATVKSRKITICQRVLYLNGTCKRCEMANRKEKNKRQNSNHISEQV